MIKYLQFVLILLVSSFYMKAQNSYVYIEGIKGIPFNVKSESKEVSKLGKGYCILTYSTPGEKTIDISFLNSNFNTQRFVLDVQANSSYGFRMGKTDENKFYLIDLVNEGKIIETNTPVNLALSSEKNTIKFFIPKKIESDTLEASIVSNDSEPVQETKPIKKKSKNRAEEGIENQNAEINSPQEKQQTDSASVVSKETKAERKAKRKAKSSQVIATEPIQKEEKFGVVEVITDNSTKAKPTEAQNEKSETKVVSSKPTKNAACTKIASEEEVKSIIDKLGEKDDDEAKLLLIKKRIVSGCYSSKQVFDIAQHFDTQYGRYSLVRFVYPLTSDPGNLMMLDSLFKYETYKVKLKKIVENP